MPKKKFKLVKRMGTPDAKRFWKDADKISEEVRNWPKWKRSDPISRFEPVLEKEKTLKNLSIEESRDFLKKDLDSKVISDVADNILKIVRLVKENRS